MFEATSRYYSLETVTLTADDCVIAYKRRRFLPRGDALPILVELVVAEGDRLDVIAARTLGDPEHYWRICDASNAMNPADLTAEPGRTLRVPIPQAER